MTLDLCEIQNTGRQMTKRTLVVSSLLVLGAMLTVNPTSANTVAMDFTGPQGNQSGGVYTYPYNFSIDGSGSYHLLCTTFTREITTGQQWTATTLTMSDLNSVNVQTLEFPTAGVAGYLEAADLFVQEATAFAGGNTDPEGLYNWAIWDLLSGQDVSASHLSAGDDATVQGYLSGVESLSPSLTPSEFSNVVIYTPVDLSPSGAAGVSRI